MWLCTTKSIASLPHIGFIDPTTAHAITAFRTNPSRDSGMACKVQCLKQRTLGVKHVFCMHIRTGGHLVPLVLDMREGAKHGDQIGYGETLHTTPRSRTHGHCG